jgi:predicted acyltransferase
MLLMMAEVLHLPRVAQSFPSCAFWRTVGFHTSHVDWFGCSLHDLIQPSFTFLVGVALPFSLAARRAKGQSFGRMLLHAVWRGGLLVALGVFLRSVGRDQTNFTFEDTLSQIGLGYPLLFLLGWCRPWQQAVALGLILIGYWGAFAVDPLPGDGFAYTAVGVPADWPYHLQGIAAHWNKNANLAWAFDTWFLNLFPREQPFTHNAGGYATLSFIPTLGTMVLGLLAGGWLKGTSSGRRKLLWLVLAGAGCLAAGAALDWFGVCPSVKRIWTPAWTLYSGGWCLLLMAFFVAVIDELGWSAWAYPLRVIGANSIAIYCLVHLIQDFVVDALHRHLGSSVFNWFGETWEPLLTGGAVLLIYWLILFWMHRRRIYVRI